MTGACLWFVFVGYLPRRARGVFAGERRGLRVAHLGTEDRRRPAPIGGVDAHRGAADLPHRH